jgi:hypothetical protein
MRKGEKAKIKIHKKHGFGRVGNQDKLRFPTGYDEIGSENRNKITSKGVIYEVILVDWVDRQDIDGEQIYFKTRLVKP